MKKFTKKLTNSVEPAILKHVSLENHLNNTTNSSISASIFKRECAEYDAGTLPKEHGLYLGERSG